MLDVPSQLDIPESLKVLQNNLERLLMKYNLSILRKNMLNSRFHLKQGSPLYRALMGIISCGMLINLVKNIP